MAVRNRLSVFLACACLCACFLLLALYPAQTTAAAAGGLRLCAQVVAPALFPYFVLTGLIVRSPLPQALAVLARPVMRPLFGVNGAGAAALALGLIGGYPVGARTAAELYDSGAVSKNEAERLLTFCNNSGPAFICGAVGTAVLQSGALTAVLWLSHIAGALCAGLLLCRKRPVPAPDAEAAPAPPPGAAPAEGGAAARFVAAVSGALSAILNVCAYVVFFSVAAGLLQTLLPVPDTPAGRWLFRFLTGALELSGGIASLRTAGCGSAFLTAAAALMLGWGGLSVHFQTLALLAGRGLRTGRYFAGKLLHGIFSALFAYTGAWLCLRFAPQAAAAAAASPAAAHVLTPVLPAVSAVLLLLAALPVCIRKKQVEKKRR